MTVDEYLQHCDVEGRKLRKIIFQSDGPVHVLLEGVECNPEFTLDVETVEDCLGDYDCQFCCDIETGKLIEPSIFTYPVVYEDTSKVREVILTVKPLYNDDDDTTNANQQLSKEDKEDA